MNETELLKERVRLLEGLVGAMMTSDRFLFDRKIQIGDERHITLGTTKGTKIGTATTQKLAFYNATPIAQQTGVAVTAAGIHAALVALGLITA